MSLQKYAGSDLNVISNTLQSYLDERKLKPNEIVKYRLVGGTKNIDPQRTKGEDILFPASVVIKMTARIYDPGDEGKDNGKPIEIGVVQSFDSNTKLPKFASYFVSPQKGDGGIFMIRANVGIERDMYDLLELSNENASNPFRDQTDAPIFERVNEEAEGQARSTRRNYLKQSLAAIDSWNYDKMRIVAAGFNLSVSLPMGVLKDRLEEIAEKSAQSFFEAIDSTDLEVKAIIKMAKDAGIISFIQHENKWIFAESGDVITLLNRVEGVNELDQMAEFIKNSENGDRVKANIQKMLSAKKKKSDDSKK